MKKIISKVLIITISLIALNSLIPVFASENTDTTITTNCIEPEKKDI